MKPSISKSRSSKSTEHDGNLIARVREALAEIPSVKEKKMFGSTAFLVRGKMCVSVRAERIMCRIDPDLHDDALTRPGARTVVMRGRSIRGYVYVDAAAVETAPALREWIQLALRFNAGQTKKKKAR